MVLAEVLLVAAGVLLVWVAVLNLFALRTLCRIVEHRCPLLEAPTHAGVPAWEPPQGAVEPVHIAPSDAAIEARNFDGALGGPLP